VTASAISCVCCVRDCGALASYHLDATMHAMSDEKRERPRLLLETSLVVCQAHRENPPHACIEFFQQPQRDYLDALCRSNGVDVPNYDSATWDFAPIVVAPTEVKH
jgi:hypothetical protein